MTFFVPFLMLVVYSIGATSVSVYFYELAERRRKDISETYKLYQKEREKYLKEKRRKK